MTRAAPTRGGRAWRSTVGGRSVPRAAAAVQGASLRSLPLVRDARLAVLTDPLELLRAGPPSLEALGESAGRVTGAPAGVRRGAGGPTPAPVQRNVVRAAAPFAPSSSGPPATTWRSGTMSAHGTGEHHPGTEPPSAGRRLAGDQRGPSPADVWTTAARRNPGPASLRPDPVRAFPGRSTPSDRAVSDPAGDGAVGRTTAAALDTAARVGLRHAPTTAPNAPLTPAMTPVEPRTDDRSGSAPTTPRVDPAASSATSTTASPGGRLHAPALDSGALGELLGRWEDSTRPTDAASTTGPTARSPFAPLSTAATTGFAAPERSSDAAVDDVSVDQVEVALGELLRREVEQHGLEGGLV